jgi:quinol monooxygenase YgiN
MVIVAGHITVEPQQRESYLAGCVRIVEQARRAVGCLDVAICADLVDPGRVNIFERWESQAALETFRSSGPDTEQRPAMLTVSVQEYDIADVRDVFGKVRNGSAGRTLLRPMRSAPRSGRIERRQTQREGNCDHETDDHRAGLR